MLVQVFETNYDKNIVSTFGLFSQGTENTLKYVMQL